MVLTINRDQTTHYLQEMVQINSVNPDLAEGGSGEAEIAAWLAQTCAALGLEVTQQPTAPGRPNVLARWPGSRRDQSLLLFGHTDTVGVENMTANPFSGHIDDGKLYGRGALDMKGGLAAILGAVSALRAAGFQPASDLWLAFVTDEEYFSIGADALIRQIQPAAAILTEPTDLQVCIAHKGFAWLTLTTGGQSAHGSRYDLGHDAITAMRHLLAELDRLETEAYPQRIHPLLGRSSVHASTIYGGLGWSTYPDRCLLQIEHRLLPDQTAEEVLAGWQHAIQRLSDRIAGFSAEVTLDFARPAYEIARDAPLTQTLHRAYHTVTGSDPTYTGMPFWMDSAVLDRASIPTVIFGPGGAGMHAPIEYVRLRDVFTCAAVLAASIQLWTK